MSISFLPYVFNSERGRWDFPDASDRDPESFELNVSNANGADLLLVIGLDPDVERAPLPIEHFSSLVTAALRRHLGRRSPH
ncbi:MAG: hypothetical protein WBO09_01835 [Methylocystis silviterrae]|uniref:hypothetical protein n=1 Tax=Methylocystis silviterrae TaxID=2743612 RepID=UPI003C74B643